jgi:hypothetical protein
MIESWKNTKSRQPMSPHTNPTDHQIVMVGNRPPLWRIAAEVAILGLLVVYITDPSKLRPMAITVLKTASWATGSAAEQLGRLNLHLQATMSETVSPY